MDWLKGDGVHPSTRRSKLMLRISTKMSSKIMRTRMSQKELAVPDIKDTADDNGQLLNQQPVYDKILRSEVSLQLGENITVWKVTKRALGPDGTVAGTYDETRLSIRLIYPFLCDSVLPVSVYSIVADTMLTCCDVIYECVICESTVVCMVMFHCHSSSCLTVFFESLSFRVSSSSEVSWDCRNTNENRWL